MGNSVGVPGNLTQRSDTMKTAVSAPTEPPYEDLFVVIDAMTMDELVAFTTRLLKYVQERLASDEDLRFLHG